MSNSEYQPGDSCRLGPNYTAIHADDCPEWPGGTVTDVRTGLVLPVARSPRFTPSDSQGDVWDTRGRTL